MSFKSKLNKPNPNAYDYIFGEVVNKDIHKALRMLQKSPLTDAFVFPWLFRVRSPIEEHPDDNTPPHCYLDFEKDEGTRLKTSS